MSSIVAEHDQVGFAEDEFLSTARPWARYWSRMFDLTIWTIVTGYSVGVSFPSVVLKISEATGGNEYLLGIVLLPLAMMVDSVCMAAFGQTPGKAIAGIRVVQIGGDRLSFAEAFARDIQVYVKGLGLGIPIVALFTLVASHSKVKSGQETSWDESVGTRVIVDGASVARTSLIAILYVLFLTAIQAWSLENKRAVDQEMPRQQPLAPQDPVEEQLREAAVGLKESLPKQIDQVTTLTDVRVDGRTFVYSYDITRRDTSDDQYKSFLTKNTIPKVCANPRMRELIDSYDVIYRYEYLLPRASVPMTITIDRAACSRT